MSYDNFSDVILFDIQFLQVTNTTNLVELLKTKLNVQQNYHINIDLKVNQFQNNWPRCIYFHAYILTLCLIVYWLGDLSL